MKARKNARMVMINGQMFKGLKEAANAYKLNSSSLYQALHSGQQYHRGYKICYSVKTVADYEKEQALKQYTNIKDTSLNIVKDNKRGKKRCPVKCITTGKVYPSISAAAKTLGLHMWTMSVKMEDTGKFIDKEGKEYIRLRPMEKLTNREYNTKYSEITRDICKYTKKHKSDDKVVPQKLEVLDSAEMINNSLLKSASLLVSAKNYTQAANVYNILAELNKK